MFIKLLHHQVIQTNYLHVATTDTTPGWISKQAIQSCCPKLLKSYVNGAQLHIYM